MDTCGGLISGQCQRKHCQGYPGALFTKSYIGGVTGCEMATITSGSRPVSVR